MTSPYTILNPHVSDFFGRSLAFVVLKRRALKKYGHLITVPVQRGDVVNVLVNGAHSGLVPDKIFRVWPRFLRLLWLRLEMQLWLKYNDLKGKVNVYYNPEKIGDRKALFFLCFRNHVSAAELRESCLHFPVCIAHLTHYYLTPAQYSTAVKDIPNVYLACDVDISGNPFFQHYFSWYKKAVLSVAFAVSDRFVLRKAYEARQSKAVATGTFHMLEQDTSAAHYSALQGFSNANTAHPLRRTIFEQKEKLEVWIDCYCYPYFESNVKKKKWKDFLLPKKMRVQQSSYFSFDIVDKYNDYRYAIVGEEFYNALPGIGAFEAMACGTVFIGHPDCYKGTGLVEGENFLPHHNDIPDILHTIEEANKQPERMAEMGRKTALFVKENYNPAALVDRLAQIVSSLT